MGNIGSHVDISSEWRGHQADSKRAYKSRLKDLPPADWPPIDGWTDFQRPEPEVHEMLDMQENARDAGHARPSPGPGILIPPEDLPW